MSKVLVVAEGPLRTDITAGQQVMSALVERALAIGHVVHYQPIHRGKDSFPVSVHMVGHPNLNLLEPIYIPEATGSGSRLQAVRTHFDSSTSESVVSQVESAIATVGPDALISFDRTALAASRQYDGLHRHIVPDPSFLRMWFSASGLGVLRATRRRSAALLALAAEAVEIRRIRKKTELFCFGHQHARVWTRLTGRKVRPLRPFVPKESTLAVKTSLNGPPIIAVGGSLNSTASAALLETLPAIRRAGEELFGTGGFQLRVIGRGLPDSALNLLASWPEGLYLGDVPDFVEELRQSTVFVMPAEYPVGVRTRIVSALLAGTPCIVAKSTLRNMPELGVSAAVIAIGSIDELPQALAVFVNSGNLADASRAAIECYEMNYSTRASDPLMEGLEV